MTTLDTLLQRNQDFAAQHFDATLPMRPTLQTMIIGCADPRVDPVHVLGLTPGEAVVLRNVGGRITPGTLQLMRMLTSGVPADGGHGFTLIVLQHTNCGIVHMAAHPALLTDYFGIAAEEFAAKAVTDPRAAVAVDVATLRANPILPGGWTLVGLLYDTATGHMEVVVPPAPLREDEVHV